MLFRIGRMINITLSLFWQHAKNQYNNSLLMTLGVGMIPDTQDSL